MRLSQALRTGLFLRGANRYLNFDPTSRILVQMYSRSPESCAAERKLTMQRFAEGRPLNETAIL